jgi:surface-adhesin protein E
MILELMAAMLAQGAAAQDRWVTVFQDDQRSTFLDRQSIENAGQQRRLVTRTDYRVALEDGTQSTDYYQVIDCQQRTFSLISFVNRGRDGAVISEATIPEGQRRVSPVRPNTQAETITELVCR